MRKVKGIRVVKEVKEIERAIEQVNVEIFHLDKKMGQLYNLHTSTSDGREAQKAALEKLVADRKKCKERLNSLFADMEVAKISDVVKGVR